MPMVSRGALGQVRRNGVQKRVRLVPHSREFIMLYRPFATCLLAAATLSGCGIVPLDAQWKDPAHPAESLRGTTVLVVCESDEQVVKQMCQDRVAAELRALGANTAMVPHSLDTSSPTRLSDEARAVKAGTIFSTRLSPDVPRYSGSSGVSVGLGMGGGFGRGGFGGVGVSAPIGGSHISQGYVANASLSEVATGRLMWTAKASTQRSDDLNWQVDSLTKAVVGGAQQAGFF